MVTDGNHTYCGVHFVKHKIIESLCSIPETNKILHITYTLMKTKIKNSQSDKTKGILLNN